jgi:triphosphoribosyl-dephospho-CoA synthase
LIPAAAIEAFFVAACRAEIEALKPGNVHIFSPGHGMTAEHFFASAEASAGPLCTPGKAIGERIYDAVAASFAAVGMNTNLGIILLCAPLAAAAERNATGSLQDRLAHVLRELDTADTESVFAALRLANPAGLGTAARHDAHGPADVTLMVAMAEAADRDLIAAQYVRDFDDVFVTGWGALADARTCGLTPPWSTTAVYLSFLAAFPDSHITRKHGAAAALQVQHEAAEINTIFQAEGAASQNALLTFDARLKAQQRNPGTSADLTVATLFADLLRNSLLKRRNDG